MFDILNASEIANKVPDYVNIILPRNSRQTMVITVPETCNFLEEKEHLMKSMTDNLKKQTSKNKYLFLDILLDVNNMINNLDDIDENHETCEKLLQKHHITGRTSYLCIFLQIPKLQLKIIATTIHPYSQSTNTIIESCKFYLGLDQTDITTKGDIVYHKSDDSIENKYHVDILVNKFVPIEEFAFYNRLGEPVPYASNPINICHLVD